MSQATQQTEQAQQQAKAQLEAIHELMEAMEEASTGNEVIFDGEAMDWEDLQERGQELPLSVLVRSAWQTPGESLESSEFEILLCTGGPAVRIRGNLSQHRQPESAHIEYQDWFTSWQRLPVNGADEEALLGFAWLFWFGE